MQFGELKLEDAKKKQKSKGRFESAEQKVTLKNIKVLYESS